MQCRKVWDTVIGVDVKARYVHERRASHVRPVRATMCASWREKNPRARKAAESPFWALGKTFLPSTLVPLAGCKKEEVGSLCFFYGTSLNHQAHPPDRECFPGQIVAAKMIPKLTYSTIEAAIVRSGW